jgi:Holliday junction resolvase RusA-like endonuclease
MIKFTIPVAPVTKKNHSRIIHRGSKHLLLPSEQYERYEKEAGWFIVRNCNIDYKINVKALYYMNTKRIVDLNGLNQALHDVLVKYKVIKDDNSRIVYSTDGSRVLYDKENPRTEIEITAIQEQEKEGA